ncbi:patatin-like phospholipase family protein [Streptomyces sp. NPDC056144]|uniref:patatin-like phospholipase family protein n=1 Tax=unclassified Streptomyces TaxID=2593676 RepID=UPI0035E05959
MSERPGGPVAFVFGGGGVRGAHQVGMVRALLEAGITPDLIVGTSIGSALGAVLASDPTPRGCDTMDRLTAALTETGAGRPTLRSAVRHTLRRDGCLMSNEALGEMIEGILGRGARFEDLAVPFQACASSIERATARYFDSGPLVPAVLASCALSGLFPPVEIGGEHYIDGGVVETAPIGRAISWGARTVYVLRLKQWEPDLTKPRWIWQAGKLSYELARRYHLGQALNQGRDDVVVHNLPSGEDTLQLDGGLRFKSGESAETRRRRSDEGYRRTKAYLATVAGGRRVEQTSVVGLGSVRFPTRAEASATGPVTSTPTSASATPFLRSKLDRFFRLVDRNGNGWASEADLLAMADRFHAAFALPPRRDDGLHAALGDLWKALCHADGVDPAGTLDRAGFTEGLHRVALSPALYDSTVLPVVAAVMDAADRDRNRLLTPKEVTVLLGALGVAERHAVPVGRRLDTNDDGVVTLDELAEAFHVFFTAPEPGAAGNDLFGGADPAA